ncbi:helix-turn-helix domain-containing protein [Streptomyces goshikiensis]|uniref:helix-turn-helix domain-containing protein n=1 Tax=Streptomyces goshikiensis TaxID=1942 RepID=UPI0036634C21
MDHNEHADPVATISGRARQLRRRKDWTAAELGERMVSLGVPWDRSIVANLENGRRKSVSVSEWLALAVALDVAPVHLLVPPEGGRYQPTPALEYEASTVRAWIRGEEPLPGVDARTFRMEAPEGEWTDPDLPEEAQAENDVTRHLLASVELARRAGLAEEQVVNWIRGAWRLADTMERGPESGGER